MPKFGGNTVYTHDFATNGGTFFPAGKIDELEQTVKNSEHQITDFGAQVHNLEMDSMEKDARIEKYEAQVKYQEGA